MELNLLPENVIDLWTRNGMCQIQLLSGDITRLDPEDKADIVMVSAFPGDYSPLRGTVIGALHHCLQISVGKLATNKGLDLRTHYSCWLSKEITVPNSPYRKLLCFERNRHLNMSVAEEISNMFRVFTPVFNNQDNTVITPILASGHQSHDQSQILAMMVKAAAHWIEAGLPLRCFKIVIYGRIEEEDQMIFSALKTKLIAKNNKFKSKIFKKKYDVYISYSPEDHVPVQQICKSLLKWRPETQVYSTQIAFKKDVVWQDQIFKLMVSCRQVIAVLTPAFLNNYQCLEQYNIAVCCSHLFGVEVLIPFYVQTIENLPSYMGLIQWIDCREKKEGDKLTDKLSQACAEVVEVLSEERPIKDAEESLKDEEKFANDVFISYSHKNPQSAEAVLQTFNTMDDTVKVFYDRSALTSGSNWQNMLYQSLGCSRCVIVLMSPTYLSSVVCMEEYNIALARYLAKDKGMKLIPLCIEDIETVPSQLSEVKLLDARGDKFSGVIQRVAQTVTDWLHGRETQFPDILHTDQVTMKIDDLVNVVRSRQVTQQYSIDAKKDFVRTLPLDIPKSDRVDGKDKPKTIDILLSFGNDSVHCAGAFCYIIDKLYPGLNISILSERGHNRMAALDAAQIIVMFVSSDFLKSDHFLQELHMAICRQRIDKEKKVLYLIQTTELLSNPYFAHLLPYDVSFLDEVWRSMAKQYKKKNKDALSQRVMTVQRPEFKGTISCLNQDFFALVKATHDVLECILKNGKNDVKVTARLLNVVNVYMQTEESRKADLDKVYPLHQVLKQVTDVQTEAKEKADVKTEIRPASPEDRAARFQTTTIAITEVPSNPPLVKADKQESERSKSEDSENKMHGEDERNKGRTDQDQTKIDLKRDEQGSPSKQSSPKVANKEQKLDVNGKGGSQSKSGKTSSSCLLL